MRFQAMIALGVAGWSGFAFAQNQALDEAMNGANSKEVRFTGSPITLKLKDADIHEVFRMIGETSGFNIVISPEVKGKLTLSLEEVPWDQALNVVLTTMKLGADRKDNVMRILPREMLVAEKRLELENKKLSESVAPRVTRIFPVSYASLEELSGIISRFSNDAGGGSSNTVTVITDKDTQSLIVRDTAENLEKIAKLIELLDVQTPQVMIEAKVLEATEQFARDLSGSLAVGGASFKLGSNTGVTSLIGTTAVLPGTTSPAAGAFAGVASGLNATLRIGESENKVRIVSSPKTVVLSGKTANVKQTKTTAKTLVTPATPTSPAMTTIQQITADTILNVTPRVTNEGSVFMRLDLTRDVLRIEADGSPAKEPRNMTTEVIVESGNTLVIGGVLNIDENSASSGIPFLRKIPLLGALFGADAYNNTKSELMFFVTPRILNQRKGITEDEMKKL
jgi:type IV pilus assembly protein PilQ